MKSGHLQVKSYNDNYFRSEIKLPITLLDTQIENIQRARNLARKFSSSAFKNLDEFPYIYFTSGVTEAINFLVPRQETTVIEGEYRYVRAIETVSLKSSNMYYYSYPFSGSGNFFDLKEIESNKSVILDCSYIFASDMSNDKILPPNISYVMFGVSKSHNLHDLRLGWFFSKKRFLTLHTLQYEYGYASSLILPTLEKISLEKPNYLYNKYKSEFSELYLKNGLIEGNTNLFGLSSNKIQRIMYYELQ